MTPDEYLSRLEKLRIAKLRKQTAYVFENSAYFRDQFIATGVTDPREIDSLTAFRNLPIMMTKEQHRASQIDSLEQFGHPYGMHLCTPLDQVIHVAATSKA